MTFIDKLRGFLYEPRVRGVNVDDNRLLEIHAQVLKDKPLLKSAFQSFYEQMAKSCDKWLPAAGLEVELGSGAGFFRDVRPGLVTSDVRRAAHIDRVLDAQNLDLADGSVRCIYAINVFHHLPDPERFFSELDRVLAPMGGCILVEPHGGFSSALLHRYLHTDERFDPDAPQWKNTEIAGPLSGANQALAHIVFKRDRKKFEASFGRSLEIVSISYAQNGPRYFLSGGLNFRQLLPSWMDGPMRVLEQLASPLARHWSLHQVIVLRKRP